MKPARTLIAGLGLLAAAGVAAPACRAPTSITVLVTAPDDPVCQPRLRTAISLGTTDTYEGRAASSMATGCTSTRVGSLVVTPTGDEGEDLAIRVVSSIDGSPCEGPAYGKSCIVARRALHFIPHESLTVVVDLRASCEGVACDSTSTCVDRVCHSATIGDPSQCASGAGCGEGALGPPKSDGADGGDAGDASVADSTVSDATTLDASDATTLDASDATTLDGDADSGGDASALTLVTVGDFFACARRSNGTAACWGLNADGQLGLYPGVGADAGPQPLPVDAPALGSPLALSGGDELGCELVAGGVMRCWGNNRFGELGFPDAGLFPPTTVLAGALDVCAGASATCAIDASGAVRCWSGSSQDGQPVVGIAGAVQLACGSDVACARVADGTVRCWGSNGFGALGVPDAGGSSASAVQPPITGVVDLATYYRHTCVALQDGGVMCWGINDALQTDPSYDAGPNADAASTNPSVDSPRLVAGVSGATRVAVGLFHSCALLGNGTVTCWGYNAASQTGTSGCTSGCPPAPVSLVSHAVRIAGALDETCVVLDDGGVWCWGTNSYGELGRGTFTGDELAAPVHL